MPPFTLSLAQASDLDEVTAIWCAAMSGDIFWNAMVRDMTEEQINAYVRVGRRMRLTVAMELGVSQVWKLVDEETG